MCWGFVLFWVSGFDGDCYSGGFSISSVVDIILVRMMKLMLCFVCGRTSGQLRTSMRWEKQISAMTVKSNLCGASWILRDKIRVDSEEILLWKDIQYSASASTDERIFFESMLIPISIERRLFIPLPYTAIFRGVKYQGSLLGIELAEYQSLISWKLNLHFSNRYLELNRNNNITNLIIQKCIEWKWFFIQIEWNRIESCSTRRENMNSAAAQ